MSRLEITNHHICSNRLTGAGYAFSSTDAGCMAGHQTMDYVASVDK